MGSWPHEVPAVDRTHMIPGGGMKEILACSGNVARCRDGSE